MSLNEFLKIYDIKMSLPTLRSVLQIKAAELKNAGAVIIVENKVRTRYTILNPDLLLKLIS